MADIIDIDRRVLRYLAEHGGRLPAVALPLHLFRGEIPPGHPDMMALGLITHDGDDILITDLGRAQARA